MKKIIAAAACAVTIAGCSAVLDKLPPMAQVAYQKALDLIDDYGVRGRLTAADAAMLTDIGAEANDRVLNGAMTRQLRDLVGDKTVDVLARLCRRGFNTPTQGLLTAEQAAATSLIDDVAGDPVWIGTCNEAIKLATGKD